MTCQFSEEPTGACQCTKQREVKRYSDVNVGKETFGHSRFRAGLGFFGTPHGGGNELLVVIASILAYFARTAHCKPKNDILKTLKGDSTFPDLLNEQWRHQLESYQIVSFYEADGKVSLNTANLLSFLS